MTSAFAVRGHTAKQIIYVVTVMEATPVAATAIVLTVVSDALSWAELYSRLAP